MQKDAGLPLNKASLHPFVLQCLKRIIKENLHLIHAKTV